MRKTKRWAAALLLGGVMLGTGGCMRNEIDDIKDTLSQQEARIAALEEWQASVNESIRALQGLVEALEANDFVTGVSPLPDGSGYVISFQKGDDITIRHGEKGGDGHTPVIGTEKDATDGRYYWTIDGEPLVDEDGNRLPVTGDKGDDAVAPVVRIDPDTDEWEVSTDGGETYTSTGVKATGADGTACGITNIEVRERDVVFTWGEGDAAQAFTIPLAGTLLAIEGADEITEDDHTFTVRGEVFTQGGLVVQARVESMSADGTGIATTRSTASASRWTVEASIVGDVLSIDVLPSPDTEWYEEALLKLTVSNEAGEVLATGQKLFTNGIFTGVMRFGTANQMYSALYYYFQDHTLDPDRTYDLTIRGEWPAEVGSTEINEVYYTFLFFQDANLGHVQIDVPQCTQLYEYTFEDMRMQSFRCDYLKSVPNGLFWKSTVEEVYLPNVTTVGQSAFDRCSNLREVYMPKLATVTGMQVFFQCKQLEQLDLPQLTTFNSMNYGNFARECSNLRRVNMPLLTMLPGSAFLNDYSLTEVNFPELDTMSYHVFDGCRNLVSVSMPKLRVLSQTAFQDCSSLTSISSSALRSVHWVDHSAFKNCTALREVSLPASRTLGPSAFENCTSLQSLSLDSIVQVDPTAFDGVPTEQCLLVFAHEPATGNLDLDNRTWMGKTWKRIVVQ